MIQSYFAFHLTIYALVETDGVQGSSACLGFKFVHDFVYFILPVLSIFYLHQQVTCQLQISDRWSEGWKTGLPLYINVVNGSK